MVTRSRIKTLVIDGKNVGGHEDETILELARENGIKIPTLCEMQGLSIAGACRLCLVEVKGWNKLVPACATYIDEGMEVNTDTPQLQRYRKQIIELLFAEGNHVCAVCVSNGNCQLQNLNEYLGVENVHFPYLNPIRSVDMSHERFVLDRNRCVLCARCVRVCDEIEGAHTWDVKGRGIEARVISDLDEPWGDSSSCTACGKCINVCPTGALVEKHKPTGDMIKRTRFLPYLKKMRGDKVNG